MVTDEELDDWSVRMAIAKRRSSCESGFSLVEMMIAVSVLAIGLLSVAGLFGYCLSTMQMAQEDLVAREKAKQGLENVIGARDDAEITFDQIDNVSNGGIFLDGFQKMYFPPGADGIVNTADDATSANSQLDAVIYPGPDGILGTADDVVVPLTNFTRQIQIKSVPLPSGDPNPDLRQVIVTVQYTVSGRGTRQYQVSSYISRYR